MDLKHHFHVPASVEDTWAHFQDVSGLAACFPGAQVTSVDGDEFTGSCKVKLGPIALVYNGSGTFTGRDENAHRIVVEAKGKDKRGNGTAAATATLTMSGAATGGTDVEVVTDLAVTGKPAQFGRGLIQDVSDKLLGQFVTCLEQQLTGGDTADSAAPAPTAPAPAAAASAPAAAPAPAPAAAPATPPPAAPIDAAPIDAAPVDAARVTVPAPASDAPVAAPAPARAPAAVRREPPAAPPQPEALDLGATVLPVLLRSYWKPALAGAVTVAIVIRILRSRSRQR